MQTRLHSLLIIVLTFARLGAIFGLKLFLALFLALFFRTDAAFALEEPKPLSAKELQAKLNDSSARATLVNLWATWCSPCTEELPDLVKLYKRRGKEGFRLILISADSTGDLKEASALLAKVGVDFETYRLAEPPDKFIATFIKNWSATLPTSLLTNAKGAQIRTWVGRVPMKELEKRLSQPVSNRPGSGDKGALAHPGKIGSH